MCVKVGNFFCNNRSILCYKNLIGKLLSTKGSDCAIFHIFSDTFWDPPKFQEDISLLFKVIISATLGTRSMLCLEITYWQDWRNVISMFKDHYKWNYLLTLVEQGWYPFRDMNQWCVAMRHLLLFSYVPDMVIVPAITCVHSVFTLLPWNLLMLLLQLIHLCSLPFTAIKHLWSCYKNGWILLETSLTAVNPQSPSNTAHSNITTNALGFDSILFFILFSFIS